jgi:hypothetical protein
LAAISLWLSSTAFDGAADSDLWRVNQLTKACNCRAPPRNFPMHGAVMGSFSEPNYRREQPVIAGATIDRSFA